MRFVTGAPARPPRVGGLRGSPGGHQRASVATHSGPLEAALETVPPGISLAAPKGQELMLWEEPPAWVGCPWEAQEGETPDVHAHLFSGPGAQEESWAS